jgi:pseudouridine-5'-phosphate glycosidase
MSDYLDIRPQVKAALNKARPVVALESSVIAHGLLPPANLKTALAMESAVREAGAVPATIAVLEGRLVVGLAAEEIEILAQTEGVDKVSLRDLAPVVRTQRLGATTVAATLSIAEAAGIAVVATGGIGGVHRGAHETFDVSADLTALGYTRGAVVCSGAKAILDLPRTLEVLESRGVPVVGYGTGEVPAFFSRESGLAVDHRVESPEEAAQLMKTHWGLGLSAGIVFAQPPPQESALPRAEVEALISEAVAEGAAAGIWGKDLTPYLLSRLVRSSGGRTLQANVDLLLVNARLAARIAAAYAKL